MKNKILIFYCIKKLYLFWIEITEKIWRRNGIVGFIKKQFLRQIKIFEILMISSLLVTNLVMGESLTTGADFLKIGFGGRQTALGSATCASVNDIESLNANIAGLSGLRVVQLMLEHSEMFESFRYESLSAALPISRIIKNYDNLGVVGVNFIYFYMPTFERYGNWGEVIDKVGYNSYKVSLGYSKNLMKNKIIHLSGGLIFLLSGKNVDNNSESQVGINVGLKAKIYNDFGRVFGKNINVGLNFKNIGFQGYGHNENLPVIMQAGAEIKIYNIVGFEMDLVKYFDSSFMVNVGAEYSYKNLITFRLGGRFGGTLLNRITTGFGIKYKIFSKNVNFDYSLLPFSKLGITHRISLKIDLENEKKGIDADADIYYYRGVKYFMNSDYKNAIKMWRKTLQIDPKYEKVKERIKELRNIIEWEKDAKNIKKTLKNEK